MRRTLAGHRQQVLELVRGAWQRRLSTGAQHQVPLSGALHRVLARDIAAPVSLPPFANSQMDGYAVDSRATAGATVFEVAPPVPAGRPAGALAPGCAVPVMTGAMLPAGAEFIEASEGGRLDTSEGKVVWNVGGLKAGSEQVFDIKCRLKQPGANQLQVAAVADDDLRGAHSMTTDVEALADLSLRVTDPQGPMPVGREALCEVQISNRGTKSAEQINNHHRSLLHGNSPPNPANQRLPLKGARLV